MVQPVVREKTKKFNKKVTIFAENKQKTVTFLVRVSFKGFRKSQTQKWYSGTDNQYFIKFAYQTGTTSTALSFPNLSLTMLYKTSCAYRLEKFNPGLSCSWKKMLSGNLEINP